jgi:4-hydroxy-tetrahydrodipicolinate synthase
MESAMKEIAIKGIIPALVTPMNEDESINVTELRAQVDRQIKGGVHGIFCFGTNGEGYILNGKEKQLVLETVVEQTNGRVPVYAGTGCISTKETIEQCKMAQAAGADVLSLITPSFAAASQNELYEHYKTVAAAVDMPIVLYNIPARTGNSIAPATLARLAQIDNIVGAKDSSGNFVNILSYIDAGKSRAKGDFAVLSGNDQLIIWNLIAGGTGGIAGCANVYPHVMASIYDLFMEGKIEEAKEANASIASFRACFKYGNPNTIVKTAVALLGYNVGKCRAPFNQVPEEGIEAIKKVLAENAAKGMC